MLGTSPEVWLNLQSAYDQKLIEINCVLNSNSVPREAVKYVIYHEMLHRDNRFHDAAFKREEHKYPKYEEWDHFLEDNMNQFDIKEW
jgi:predicted metal-dependent hydrolase